MYEAAASLHWWTMAKQPQILAQESLTEMLFPLRGIDVACVFDQQPPDSTPVGLNVRAYESLTERARGGSRPGLSRYINAQVSGSNKIQHLTYIVDPQAVALGGGTPPGPPTAPNRNLFGGSGGLAPVRYPVEPGRTYPPSPTPPVTFTVFLSLGGMQIIGTLPTPAGGGTVTLNGSLVSSPTGSVANVIYPANPNRVSINAGTFTVNTKPAGMNTLVLSLNWNNCHPPGDDFNFTFNAAQLNIYANIPGAPSLTGPTDNSDNGSSTVTFTF